jgi:hypothetical protein
MVPAGTEEESGTKSGAWDSKLPPRTPTGSPKCSSGLKLLFMSRKAAM